MKFALAKILTPIAIIAILFYSETIRMFFTRHSSLLTIRNDQAPRNITGLILSILCLAGSAVYAQPEPTLSLDFENGVDGIGNGGKAVTARVQGKPDLIAGRFSNALKSGPDTGFLRFPTKGILSSQAGTVEMWVSPQNWAGNDGKFHVFFDTLGEGALSLYKHFNNRLLMRTHTAPSYQSAADVSDWKPGEWHHIAGTWTPNRRCIYVDGKLVGTFYPGPPHPLASEFTLGESLWQGPNYLVAPFAKSSQTLIDRVRIYDRPLSRQQIADHFNGNFDKVTPLDQDSAHLDYSITPETKLLTANLELSGDVGGNEPQVKFYLASKGDPAEKGTDSGMKSPANGIATTTFSLTGLKPGDYELTAVVSSGDKVLLRNVKAVPVISLEWMGNKLGLEDKVLPPWTPLKIEDGKNLSVACWGRDYSFGNAALPVQIKSKGEALLAAPVNLVVTVAGKTLQWEAQNNVVKSRSAVGTDIQGYARARASSGMVELNTRMRLEYDGFMVLNLGLKIPPGIKPDAISLNIPLRNETSFYRHSWGPSGSLEPINGTLVSQEYVNPFYWIGDNDRGLSWICESGRQWPNYAGKNAFQVVRARASVTMRMNLLDKGQAFPKNWDYQFGLQATPVKPVPQNGRGWRAHPVSQENVIVPWPYPEKDSYKYYGYPEAAVPEIWDKRVRDLQAEGIKVVPYSCLNQISEDAPEWKWFGPSWDYMAGSQTSGSDPNSDVIAFGALFQIVSPQSPSYQDFIVWKNKQFIDRYKFDGYYHDNAGPAGIMNELAGSNWRDERGALQPVYCILAQRQLYRRLYSVVKSKNPNALMIAHMSGAILPPVAAYEDVILNGEQIQLGEFATDSISLDNVRAQFMGRQFGFTSWYQPVLAQQQREEPTRGLMGLLLAHDITIWNSYNNRKVVNDTFDALAAFGYADTDFIPYFDPAPPAVTDMKNVLVSIYKRADGRALAIVANTGKTAQSGSIQFNTKRIGLPLDNIVNWPDKASLKRDGREGSVSLDLPANSFRMLLIGKMPEAPVKAQ